jgi:hypothetical protein
MAALDQTDTPAPSAPVLVGRRQRSAPVAASNPTTDPRKAKSDIGSASSTEATPITSRPSTSTGEEKMRVSGWASRRWLHTTAPVARSSACSRPRASPRYTRSAVTSGESSIIRAPGPSMSCRSQTTLPSATSIAMALPVQVPT